MGDELNDLLNDQNRKAISETLANLRDTTGVLASHSADLDATIVNLEIRVGRAQRRPRRNMQTTLANADTALDKIGKLSERRRQCRQRRHGAQISELVAQSRSLVTSLKRLSNELDRQPTKLIFGDRREGYTPK